MRLVALIFIFLMTNSLNAQEFTLKPDGEFRLVSNIHLVDELLYKKDEFQAFIEVPSGTTAKWEVNHETGHLEWEFKNGKPRNVKYLGYPGNYGFIPQCVLDKGEGGDGHPLDIIVLGPAVDRGTVQQVRILGAIKLLDKGKPDNKIIAIPLMGPFKKIDSISEMMMKFPGVIQIVRYWFEGYKDPGKMVFMGYMNRIKAEAMIEKAHVSWGKQKNGL